MVDDAEQQVREVVDSRPLRLLGRVGLVSYGVVYLLVSVIAVQVALGGGGQADKAGALETLAGSGLGLAVIWLITIGLWALVVWLLAEAVWGDRHVSAPGRRLWRRVLHVGESIAIGYLAYSAGKIAAAGGTSSESAEATGLFALPGGRLTVGAIGIGVLAISAYLVYRGVRKKFLDELDLTSADWAAARLATRLGQVGFPALGFAFATVGVLLVIAALRFDPEQPVGLDAGLRTLAGQPYGPYLLVLLAAGIACYGVYCLFDARYRRS